MSRAYYQSHQAKRLEINFNQKQWRQDFADFVKRKLSWTGETVVTRSKALTKGINIYYKGIKSFEISNVNGGSVYVEYQDGNVVTNTTARDLIDEYLEMRNLK